MYFLLIARKTEGGTVETPVFKVYKDIAGLKGVQAISNPTQYREN